MSGQKIIRDTKKTFNKWLIYLLISFPFMIIVGTIITALGAPLWAILLCEVLFGALVLLICYVIGNKRQENKAKKREQNNNYDPFRD